MIRNVDVNVQRLLLPENLVQPVSCDFTNGESDHVKEKLTSCQQQKVSPVNRVHNIPLDETSLFMLAHHSFDIMGRLKAVSDESRCKNVGRDGWW